MVSEPEHFDPADEAWLFDGRPAPDADSARIERLLALQRRASVAPLRRTRARTARYAAAALLLAALGAGWFAFGRGAQGYRVWSAGSEQRLHGGEQIAVGASGARLEVPGLGHVRLEQGAEFQARAPQDGKHRFFLARGAVEASITAEPGAFGIDTPAGSSIDLGCVYRLSVEADGATRLAVRTGRVSFEHAGSGREVYVPAGASCLALVGRGPHSPVWDFAAPAWRARVARLDFDPQPDAAALAELRTSDDTLALWHLLEAQSARTRTAAFGRLAELETPPPGTTPELFASSEPSSAQARAARLAWLERMDWFSYAF